MRFSTYKCFHGNSKRSWVHRTQHPHRKWELRQHSFHQAFRANKPQQATIRTSREFTVQFRWEKDRRFGKKSILVSFAEGEKVRTETVTFDIVNMDYLYTAIFSREVLNKFEIMLKQSYLCMKMASPFSIIAIHGDQTASRQIEGRPIPGIAS